MKALEEPYQDLYGMNYNPDITDEFRELLDKAKEIIEPFVEKEISGMTVYFKVKGWEVSPEFDCCDDKKCIEKTKADIRKIYGKGTHVEECWHHNDGDHERIETCYNCGKPLNEWLTWCKIDLEYLEENEWDLEFIKSEAFLIHCILESCPTIDYEISSYSIHSGGEILKKALELRENFFQRIGRIAQSILEINFNKTT